MNVSPDISEPCHLRIDHLVNWWGILRGHQNPWNDLISHENCTAALAPGDTPGLSVGSQGGPEQVLHCHDSSVEFPPWAPRLGWSCIPLLGDAGPQGSRGLNRTPAGFPGGSQEGFLTWGESSGPLAFHISLERAGLLQVKGQGERVWKLRGSPSPQGLWGFGFPVPNMVLHLYRELLFLNTPWAKRSLIEQVCMGMRPVCDAVLLRAPGAGASTSPASASRAAGSSMRRLCIGAQPLLPSFPFPFLNGRT